MLDFRGSATKRPWSDPEMPARVLSVSPSEPREDRIREAVTVLGRGGVVALPTETFYGLAADALDEDAVTRVQELKGKPPGSPALLLIADRSQVDQIAATLPERFDTLTERFWPGPLTLVVPAGDRLPAVVSGGRGTVGCRVPGLALPRRVAAGLGRPITGVSANLHGQPPCRTPAEVARAFADGLDLILDGGPTPGGAPSTVLDITGPRARVLREGAIPTAALRAFLPELR